jgi:hypothetical protein
MAWCQVDQIGIFGFGKAEQDEWAVHPGVRASGEREDVDGRVGLRGHGDQVADLLPHGLGPADLALAIFSSSSRSAPPTPYTSSMAATTAGWGRDSSFS